MPTPAEELTVRSSRQERNEAISSCVSMMMEQEGFEQERAVAACHAMADKSMGIKTGLRAKNAIPE